MTTARKRPKNILFLWTDQQRPDTIAAYGNPEIQTPHLDRLAGTGALFQAAYCAQPVCSPARASVLTGLYPHTHGVVGNSIPLPARATTLAEMLRPDGYVCGYVGKWHLGSEHAAQRGFEDFWSSTENYRGGYAEGDPTAKNLSTYQQWLIERGALAPETAAALGRPQAAALPEEFGKPAFQASECLRFLNTFGDRPFLLMCNFLEPHPPVNGPFDGMYRPEDMTLPPSWYREMEPTVPLRIRRRRDDPLENEAHYRHLKSNDEWGWKELKARYWGLCTLVDKYVGHVLDHLEALNLASDTIVVHSADHGDMMGEHRLLNKGLQYEGSARVPLLMRVPGLGPQRIATPVSQVDLVPTLLELLEQPAAEGTHGTSRVPLLRGGDRDPESAEVAVEWNGYDNYPAAYRQNAERAESRDPGLRWQLPEVRTIIRGHWKLNVHLSGEHELYDLRSDPGELHNAYHDAGHQPVVTDLWERLRAWQQATADPLVLPEPTVTADSLGLSPPRGAAR